MVLDLVGAGSVIFIMSKIFIMCILIDQLEEILLGEVTNTQQEGHYVSFSDL